jgi:hypothetical protein
MQSQGGRANSRGGAETRDQMRTSLSRNSEN